MKLRKLAVAATALLAASAALAFPIAPFGTEGVAVTVTSTEAIVATYQGNSASYSDDLYLALDGLGNPGDDGDLSNDLFLFNNHASAEGSNVALGSFAIGTTLVFRLHVNDTGDDFYTGPAIRNADGRAHARVQSEWLPNEALVSFEDLFGTPEYPDGFNDLSFSFTNTRGGSPRDVDVPEPATLALIGLALGAAALKRRKQV